MSNLKRTEDYILSIIGEEEETANVDRKAIIESKYGADNPTPPQRSDIFLQTAALVGVDLAATLIDKARKKSSKERVNESQNTIVNDVEKSDKVNIGDVLPKNVVENLKSSVNEHGINALNRWSIEYGENKAIDEKDNDKKIIRDLMAIYTTEIGLPSNEISTKKNTLSFIDNEDVSDLKYGDLTVTIMLDRNMKIYNAIHNIIYKIRNPKTGRYGYKDDYKFEFINVFINNEVEETPLQYSYVDCVLKGISEMTLNYAQKEVKTITLTFSYDPTEKVTTN